MNSVEFVPSTPIPVYNPWMGTLTFRDAPPRLNGPGCFRLNDPATQEEVLLIAPGGFYVRGKLVPQDEAEALTVYHAVRDAIRGNVPTRKTHDQISHLVTALRHIQWLANQLMRKGVGGAKLIYDTADVALASDGSTQE